MAPVKFEEHLKDKLEKRTLSPSSESWSKLSERLDAEEKKSKNPIFWWLSIAAGILIMIATTVQFFGTESSEEVIPQVVEEKINDDLDKVENEDSNTESTIQLVDQNSLRTEPDEAPIIASEPFDFEQKNHKSSQPKTKLAENNKDIKKTESTFSIENTNRDALPVIDETKLKNAVAVALGELKSENSSVTDREIDSLLKLARKELFKEKLQKESTLTVDAQALLMSVQDEMGQSFRSKVFEALKDSFETVKTAVAERNN